MIDRLLAEKEPDAELLYYRGLGDFFTGRANESQRAEYYAAAHKWFAKAIEADPNHYTALYRLALTAPLQDAASEEIMRALIAAHDLAPLVGDIAVDAAKALVAQHRYAEAEEAILPIATDPHGGSGTQAQALLKSIRAQAIPARQPPFSTVSEIACHAWGLLVPSIPWPSQIDGSLSVARQSSPEFGSFKIGCVESKRTQRLAEIPIIIRH